MSTYRNSSSGFLIAILFSSSLFMVVLDFSIVTIALPSIQREFHSSTQTLQWVVSAYALSFGGFLLLGGRCADLFGRRRMFILGLLLFIVSSLGGALAQSPIWLIIARALQGLAASFLSPAALSLITTNFQEGKERNRALAIYGTSASVGYVAGTILGGILTSEIGWRWVFLVNVPIGAITILISLRVLEENYSENTLKRLDFSGAASIAFSLIALVYSLSNIDGMHFTAILPLILLAGLSFFLFIVIEMRVKEPLIPFGIFRNRALTGANIVALFWSMTSSAWIVILTFYLQNVLGYSALQTGLFFLPQGIVSIIAGVVAGRVIAQIGLKKTIVLGLSFFSLGVLIITRISTQSDSSLLVLVGTIIGSTGGAWAIIALSIVATAGVTHKDQGLASGILNTMEQVGGSLGIAITIMVGTLISNAVMKSADVNQRILVQGYQGGLVACFVFLLCGILITLFVIDF